MKYRAWTLLAGMFLSIVGLVSPLQADLIVSIQPIKVCNDAGAACANAANTLFELEGDKIWAQAGIDLFFLPFGQFNETDFLDTSTADPDGAGPLVSELTHLWDDASHGASPNPLVLSMWFVNTLDASLGFFGVARLPGTRIAIADATFTFNGGIGRLDTLAHEIGHNLGLHPGTADGHVPLGYPDYALNLMTRGADRTIPGAIGDITPDGVGTDRLTAEQIAIARSSPSAVPEPGTLSLLGLGIAGLVARWRKKS